MFLCDFKNLLAKVNPLLYVYDENAAYNFGHERISGIYLRGGRRDGGISASDKHYAGKAKAMAYLEAKESGALDTFCGGCNLGEIAEFDVFDLEFGRMVNMGWRSILLSLAKRGIISLDKAKKVFNCSSLGESDYDKLDFFGKLDYARKIGNVYER